MANEQTLFDRLEAPPLPLGTAASSSPQMPASSQTPAAPLDAAAAALVDGAVPASAVPAPAPRRAAARPAAAKPSAAKGEAKPAPRARGAVVKAEDAYRTISEVADDLDVPQHVLRFWESKFSQIRPLKRGGGRRYYRPDDVKLIRAIRTLLHHQGYTIKGVQRLLRSMSLAEVVTVAESAGPSPVLRANGAAIESAAEEAAAAASPESPAVRDDDLRLVQAALEEARALERLIGQLLPRK